MRAQKAGLYQHYGVFDSVKRICAYICDRVMSDRFSERMEHCERELAS